MKSFSRIPVCDACLNAPEPLAAEYSCRLCSAPFLTPHPLDSQGLCGLCRRGLNAFDGAFSFGCYDGTLRKLIQLFKYGRVRTMARPLGTLLGFAIPRQRVFDVVVPVPMYWRRRWARGFNQAALLAETVGKRTGLPVVSAVRRRKATPPQAGLTAARRRANMSGAFAIRRPDAVRGKRVLLVDDVLTTGATAGACAQVLKRAGAVHVSVLTVARAASRMAAISTVDTFGSKRGKATDAQF